jgi:hypothetical protein
VFSVTSVAGPFSVLGVFEVAGEHEMPALGIFAPFLDGLPTFGDDHEAAGFLEHAAGSQGIGLVDGLFHFFKLEVPWIGECGFRHGDFPIFRWHFGPPTSLCRGVPRSERVYMLSIS